VTVFRSANPFDELAPVVKKLIIANAVVFLLQWISNNAFLEIFALRPILVVKKFWIWQLVTYSFLHGNGWHLFFNLFALWMFGSNVERAMGSRPFFRFYFLCVLGAALTQLALAPNSLVIGASGGIYGLLLAFGFLFPDAIIYLFFILPLRAIQAVLFISVITFVSAIGSGGSRVAHFAHLGGLLTGFLLFKFPVWKENFDMWKAERLFRNPKGRRRKTASKIKNVSLSNEVDRILDKISAEGIDSLTPEEHEAMKRYAKKKS